MFNSLTHTHTHTIQFSENNKIKNLIKNSKGVSLISLVVTVAVILILTNVIIYNAAGNLKSTKLANMQADIENLRDKVSNYYSQYGKIPANTNIEYTNTSNINSISEATDTGPFYVIDLAAMENVTLNYGKDYEKITKESTQEEVNQLTDLYIINGTSHNVFYVEGIEVDGERYYTDYSAEDVDNSFVDLRYYDGVEIPDGFYYVGGTKDTGLVISDVSGDDLDNSKGGNQFVWIPVENEADYVRNTNYIETYNSQVAYTDTGYLPDGIQPDTDEAAYNEEAEKQAVINAKGFFISRYEAGNENGTVVSKKGATVWNNISQENCKTTAKTFINNDSVKSSLCSGIQWDVMMNFVNGKEDGKGNTFNVTGSNEDRHAGGLATSGQNEVDKVCNIYDLEGNIYEYVAERTTYSVGAPYVNRGGGYEVLRGASYRGNNNGVAYSTDTFRFVLYVIPRDNWTPIYDETTTYTDNNGDTATIPEGFAVSRKPNEKTIDDGLVIKDESGNEFVWIPVADINTMSQCSTTGGNCNLELQGNILKCTTHNSEDIVGKLYATRLGEYFGTVNTANDFLEPELIRGSMGNNLDNLSAYYKDILGYASSSAMLEDLKMQYKDMATSVANYRGFYVGRYELGLEGSNAVSKNVSINTGVTTADASNSNTNMWYGLYNKCKSFAMEDENLVSSMIWGSQYDAIMNWMQNNRVDVTLIKAGNLSTVTGSDESDKVKNIYDLYGCHYDWTLEAQPTNARLLRGGSYASISHSISYRDSSNPDFPSNEYSSRLTLYLKLK